MRRPYIRLFMNTYNTGEVLRDVLAALKDLKTLADGAGFSVRVRVFDDASTDSVTRQILTGYAQSSAAKWFWLEERRQNVGNAAGIIQGWRWALKNTGANDFVACCDADGEHSPLAIIEHLRRFLLPAHCDSVVGTVMYPSHLLAPYDRDAMRLLGGLQANASRASGVYSVHSPGYQIHRATVLEPVITKYLPDYLTFYHQRHHDLPRWGMHGVILHLLGAIMQAHIKVAYLECYGAPPIRTQEKILAQLQAGLCHLQLVDEYLATNPT